MAAKSSNPNPGVSLEINPYLNFNGTCEAAFKFYEKILGGKIESMIPHEGTPAADHVPSEWRSKIIHARMSIGNQVLMASDAPPAHFKEPTGFSVNISIADPKEGERIFSELAEGGTVHMPFQPTFWTVGFGMVVDKYGTPWMINCQQAGKP